MSDIEDRDLPVHMAAYSWIQRIPTRRGRTTIAESDKPLLMHLWSFADFRLRADATAEKVRPSRARLVRETSSTLNGVIKRLARLAAAGWIRRRGRGWDLAWQVPFTVREPIRQGIDQADGADQAPIPQRIDAEPLRSLNGSGSDPSTDRHDQTKEQKEIDQTKTESDHVLLAELPPNPTRTEAESAQPESPSKPTGRVGVTQQKLFGGDPDVEATPVRDMALEVFEYLRSRIVATKTDLGIKPARGPSVLSPVDRRNIEARIAEQQKIAGRGEGLEAGLIACRQVIDVDEADCRRKGEISQYWNATTPFRNAGNFDARLMRWRSDGNHLVFGQVQDRKPAGLRRDHGWDAYHPEEDTLDEETGDTIPGRKSMLAKILVKR